MKYFITYIPKEYAQNILNSLAEEYFGFVEFKAYSSESLFNKLRALPVKATSIVLS